MSESAARKREPIDLEEFERRLRGPAPQARDKGSLEELARLLEARNEPAPQPQTQPRQSVADFQQALASANLASRGAPSPRTSPGSVPSPSVESADPVEMAQRPAFGPVSRPRGPAGDPAGFEPPAPPRVAARAPQRTRTAPATDLDGYPLDPLDGPSGSGLGLRGAFGESDPSDDISAILQQFPDAGDRFAAAPRGGGPQADPHPEAAWTPGGEPAVDDYPAPKARKPLLLIGGAVAVCVVGLGATFAMRGTPTGYGAAPTIEAASGPFKVQPERPKVGDKPAQSASILDRNGSEGVAASRVITNEEQPLDIREAARAARITDTQGAVAPVRGAASPSSGAAPSMLPTSGPASNSFFPAPRRVRTVSVRPDGTIINEPTSAPIPPAPPARLTAPPSAAAPAIPQRPTYVAPGKSTARAAPVVAVENDPAPPRAIHPPARPVNQQVASATPAAGGGDYEVQLAGTASERDARRAASNAMQRYSQVLGGLQPTIRKANIGDREVYRVRVVGMSLEDANGLCSRLKSAGGSCFVARN